PADGPVVDLDLNLAVVDAQLDLVASRRAEDHEVAVTVQLGDGAIGVEQQKLAAFVANQSIVAHDRVGLDIDQPGAGAVQGGGVDHAAGLPAARGAGVVALGRGDGRRGRGPVDLGDADQGAAGGVVEPDAGVVAGRSEVGVFANQHLALGVEVDVVGVLEG